MRNRSGNDDAELDAPGTGLFDSIVQRHGRQYRTMGDMVYGVLREGILQGAFQPGEHLRQDRLAEAIGVSRIPVRSALLQLESEGLITFHPYRGAVVNDLSTDEMREIYEMRALLEAHALRKVAPTLAPERLDELQEMARELNAISNGETFLQRRIQFYRLLYDGERHPRLVATIEQLLTESGRFWLQHDVEYVAQPGQRGHEKILDSIRRGDIDGAVQQVQEHLSELCDELVRRMEGHEPAQPT
jgi:DNA-binding GntR family transcriptional regulator